MDQDLQTVKRMKEATNARIGIGCAGPRPRTSDMLKMRLDHAAARDTVLTDVSQEFLDSMGFFTVQTTCKDKSEYLKRPDLGRKFDENALQLIKQNCKFAPKVQVYAADGLSSSSIEANVSDVLQTIQLVLQKHGIEIGTPFFAKYARVATQDYISEVLQSEVTCVLIGERPGLATAESMSAYIVYKGTVGMEESRRTVVSNIHKDGFPPAEAGAYIAELIMQMLVRKISGVEFKR